VWYYGKREAIEPQTIRAADARHRIKSSWKLKPKDQWMPIAVEPIVPRELWERCAARVRSNRNTLGGRPSDQYILKGLLFCGKCGWRYQGWRDKGIIRYLCSHRDRVTGERLCDGRPVRGDLLENAVWTAIGEELSDPRKLEARISDHERELSEGYDSAKLAQLTARKEELRRRENIARRSALDAGAKGDQELVKF